MPTRSTWEASTPCCPRLGPVGPDREIVQCGRSLRWVDRAGRLALPRNEDYMDGRWVCPKHGSVLSGVEAAMRAGFVPVTHSEAA